jgi:hypothetical protein
LAYRNKTFVSFASEDISHYRLMTAWRANKHIDFQFVDAHDLNVALDTSQPDTIRRRLRERLANTKQVVMLIGKDTRTVAARSSRFLYYEVETIKRLDLPVVFANLDGGRSVRRTLLPSALAEQYTISVSFQPTIIKYSLDDFVAGYEAGKRKSLGPHYYKEHVYKQLGL